MTRGGYAEDAYFWGANLHTELTRGPVRANREECSGNGSFPRPSETVASSPRSLSHLTDRLQRGQAAVAADRAIERWEGRELEDQAPVPATPIETLLQKL